jgi:hypothetical protein
MTKFLMEKLPDWFKEKLKANPEECFADASQIADCLFSFVEGLSSLNNPECRPWLEMCIAIDERRGDLSSLLNLMQSAKPPAKVMPFLQDLFDRHGLLGKRGNLNRTPLYQDTLSEVRLAMACENVEELKRDGMKVEKAIDIAAEWNADGVAKTTLAHAVKGQGGEHFKRWQERVKRRQGAV